jgi:uncharacterized RDD family membrane protein YckC
VTDRDAAHNAAYQAGKQRRARMRTERWQTKHVRTLVTPEGAALNLRIASFGERCGAFLLDIGIQFILIFAFAWSLATIASALGFRGQAIAFAILQVLIFFVRNFYFIFFEIGRKAATPGKRALGLRVADRNGGRLTANAIIARNFMRELEFFLPLSILLSFGVTDIMAWIMWLLLLWCLLFALFPLFNRDKLRIGDLIAGTMVIHAPQVRLLPDITNASQDDEIGDTIIFSAAQLDAYGIHELHVLEDVLRQSTPHIQQTVAHRIAAKIGHKPQPGETDLVFLESYYRALRRHLEQRMLFGHRKADKYDRH